MEARVPRVDVNGAGGGIFYNPPPPSERVINVKANKRWGKKYDLGYEANGVDMHLALTFTADRIICK